VIPDGIYVATDFWVALHQFTSYVEFLAEEPSFRFYGMMLFEKITFIVPDASREKYLEHSNINSPRLNFIERTQFYSTPKQ